MRQTQTKKSISSGSRKPAAIGSIDHVINHALKGWYTSVDRQKQNVDQFSVIVDGEDCGVFSAGEFRPDIYAANPSFAYSGFTIPVPYKYWDGADHRVVLKNKVEDVVNRIIRLPESVKIRSIRNSIYEDVIGRPLGAGEFIAIYTAYTGGKKLCEYHHRTIAWLRSIGCYVVLVMPVSERSAVVDYSGLMSSADRVILRENVGYDFGSWLCALIALNIQECDTPRCIFINDSVIGPFGGDVCDFKNVFAADDSDLWFVADSFDRQYHGQSYFFSARSKLLKSAYFVGYLLDMFEVDAGKEEIITRYELQMMKRFTDLGFKVGVLLRYEVLKKKFVNNSIKFLNSVTDGKVLNEILVCSDGMHSLQSLAYLRNVIHNIERGIPLNPTHFFWREIIELGFPFIKKELLFSNPTDNFLLSSHLDVIDVDGRLLIADALRQLGAERAYVLA